MCSPGRVLECCIPGLRESFAAGFTTIGSHPLPAIRGQCGVASLKPPSHLPANSSNPYLLRELWGGQQESWGRGRLVGVDTWTMMKALRVRKEASKREGRRCREVPKGDEEAASRAASCSLVRATVVATQPYDVTQDHSHKPL